MLRFVVGDSPVLSFELERDSVPFQNVGSYTFALRLSSDSPGADAIIKEVAVVDADSARLECELSPADFSAPGAWSGELIAVLGVHAIGAIGAQGNVSGLTIEHAEEPFEIYVRHEYERGPR